MQRCLNMSKIGDMSAGSLARLDTGDSGPEQMIRGAEQKAKNEANRET